MRSRARACVFVCLARSLSLSLSLSVSLSLSLSPGLSRSLSLSLSLSRSPILFLCLSLSLSPCLSLSPGLSLSLSLSFCKRANRCMWACMWACRALAWTSASGRTRMRVGGYSCAFLSGARQVCRAQVRAGAGGGWSGLHAHAPALACTHPWGYAHLKAISTQATRSFC